MLKKTRKRVANGGPAAQKKYLHRSIRPDPEYERRLRVVLAKHKAMGNPETYSHLVNRCIGLVLPKLESETGIL